MGLSAAIVGLKLHVLPTAVQEHASCEALQMSQVCDKLSSNACSSLQHMCCA